MASTIQLRRNSGFLEVRNAVSSVIKSIISLAKGIAPAVAGTGATATIGAFCAGEDNFAYAAAVISAVAIAIADLKTSDTAEA